jgi:hypothetical protein
MEADPVSFSGIGPQGANRRTVMQTWSAEAVFLIRNRSEQVLKCVLDARPGLRLRDTALSKNVAEPCVGKYRHLIAASSTAQRCGSGLPFAYEHHSLVSFVWNVRRGCGGRGGVWPWRRSASDHDFSYFAFAVLRIAWASVVSDMKVTIVEPFDLHIVEPTWAVVREHSDVPTAARMLQCYLSIVTAKKASTVAQLRLLDIR